VSSPLELVRISLKGDRQLNQDRCLALGKGGDTLLALADGLGGHPRGEVAAQLLVDTCEHLFRNSDHPIRDPLALLCGCLERAHHAIVRFGMGQQPPIAPRTTGVACLVQDDRAWWCHVGDSRLYLFRDGRLIDRTHDHSRRRQVAHGRNGAGKLTITRCLGGLNLPPDLAEAGPTALLPGDTLLLSSDGFWSQFEPDELGRRLYQQGELGENLRPLVEEARHSASPRSDNTSVVALRWWPAQASSPTLARNQHRSPAKPTV
jgi:serine/threonine protein phosphatase PrpC